MQFVTFPLGRIWPAWFGTPYVFDSQDPWRTDYRERPGSRPHRNETFFDAQFLAHILTGAQRRLFDGVFAPPHPRL